MDSSCVVVGRFALGLLAVFGAVAGQLDSRTQAMSNAAVIAGIFIVRLLEDNNVSVSGESGSVLDAHI
jgi:hypothetical protein